MSNKNHLSNNKHDDHVYHSHLKKKRKFVVYLELNYLNVFWL